MLRDGNGWISSCFLQFGTCLVSLWNTKQTAHMMRQWRPGAPSNCPGRSLANYLLFTPSPPDMLYSKKKRPSLIIGFSLPGGVIVIDRTGPFLGSTCAFT